MYVYFFSFFPRHYLEICLVTGGNSPAFVWRGFVAWYLKNILISVESSTHVWFRTFATYLSLLVRLWGMMGPNLAEICGIMMESDAFDYLDAPATSRQIYTVLAQTKRLQIQKQINNHSKTSKNG